MLNPIVLCKWPIQFLQDKLYGICTGDFIVIGCASGTGKSSISRILAYSASAQDCPTVLYSLENKQSTIATELVRDKYLLETQDYETNLRLFSIKNSERQEEYIRFKQQAYEQMKRTTKSGLPALVVHEDVATQDWNIRRLITEMKKEIALGYRFFIIDHLDILAPNDEYKETKIAMNELWGLVATENLAIVTFSQLNKTCTALCPGQTDLRGGMNKVFKATHLITLGKHEYKYYEPPVNFPNAKPTYMRIAKSRDTPLSAAVCYFNGNRYLDTYIEVLCDEPGTYIDGMNRDKLQKYLAKQLNKE